VCGSSFAEEDRISSRQVEVYEVVLDKPLPLGEPHLQPVLSTSSD
jgi:hypothetical protein